MKVLLGCDTFNGQLAYIGDWAELEWPSYSGPQDLGDGTQGFLLLGKQWALLLQGAHRQAAITIARRQAV